MVEYKQSHAIQRKIHVFHTLIKDRYSINTLSYNLFRKILKNEFNFEVTLEDIITYFEPTIREEQMDLYLQMKNMGIRYE
jgi:hypothetical protein